MTQAAPTPNLDHYRTLAFDDVVRPAVLSGAILSLCHYAEKLEADVQRLTEKEEAR